MKIELISIHLKGFMSFLDSNTLFFEKYQGKSVQIDGLNKDDEKSKSNGSGKSTLLESINWGLYGELCRKNRFKDEVIHKQSKSAEVQIHFNLDEIRYYIERTIGRKKPMELKISQNGEEVLKGSTYQTKQIHLEKLIGMNFISFQCTEMFGRDFMNFPDLKPGERANILTEVRGLEKYTEASKKASDTAKLLASNTEKLNNDLSKEEGKLTGIRTTSYTSAITAWNAEREKFIELEMNKTRVLEEVIKMRTIALEKINVENQKKINETETELKVLLKSLPDRKAVQDNINQAQEELSKILAQGKYLSDIITNRVKEIENLTKNGEGPCPFCDQTITGEYLSQRINQLGLEKMQFQTDLAVNDSYKIKWIEIVNRNKEILTSSYYKEKEINEKQILLQKLGQTIIDIPFDGQIQEKRLEIQNIESEIKNKKEEINPYIELEEQRKEKIKETGTTIRKIKSEIIKFKEDQQYYEFWIEGYKKIRMMIFDTMISELEAVSQQFLSQYSSELTILMSTERETRSGTIKDEFNISIMDSNGIEISYEMYSGGERQKIRLSIARALAQLIKDRCGRDFNFITFDEPNDALDDVGKSVNFETFQELAEEGKIVLVTDHDALFKDKFGHSILIIKENGASRINA
jgi:DNA repair exonuclease SbcCD ATPase subunit